MDKKLYKIKNNETCETSFKELAEQNTARVMSHYHSSRQNSYKLTYDKKDNDQTFKGFGFEIEVDSLYEEYNTDAINAMIKDINKYYGGLFGFDHDSSIDKGVEIVSKPMTLDVIRNIDFTKFERIISAYEYGNTSDCGGHIHVSASMFGNTKKSIILTLRKIFRLFENNKNVIRAISGREYQSSFARPITLNSSSVASQAKTIDEYLNGLQFIRYTWINLLNLSFVDDYDECINTVEFRFWSTCFDNNLIKRAEFLDALIKTAKKIKLGRAHSIEDWLCYSNFKNAFIGVGGVL